MIRVNDLVNYVPVPGNRPTITHARVLKVHVTKEFADLSGWPDRTFPLKFLTKV